MFACSHCDTQYAKWQGRCSECGKWGTISEEAALAEPATIGSQGQGKNTTKKSKGSASHKGSSALHSAAPAQLSQLGNTKAKKIEAAPTGIPEVDRVLSGGLVPGSVTLLAGEPGIGKSTLVAQIASTVSNEKKPVVYISGEESEGQVQLRFDRLKLGTKHILFSNTIDIGSVLAALEKHTPSLVIIDSIQTMLAEGVESIPGTPTTVRASTSQLIGYAKTTSVPVLIIGQVTKEGTVAGPKTLEHLVDTVLALEGDTQTAYRLLRVQKHRFGTIDELGVFEMSEHGMVAVENPSAKFLEERIEAPGSAITCVIEGNRPFLVEIQALVEKSFFPNPIRRATGFDVGRLHMLLAVLSKHVGAQVGEQDVYVNVVGGMKVKETAADLAVLAAILSSYRQHVLPSGAVFVGEVGLSGELRSVPSLSRRLKEIERQGYKIAISSKNIKTVSEVFKKK